jgi:ABC-2 type transport system permease protein
MLGNWWNYALVVLALLFTSLGFGFVISLISQTDSQAVQYTMLLLLTSVFFSGFMMSLDTITPAVRVVSWSLPTTYGIVLLRDLVLRGVPPDAGLLGGLAGIGLGLCLLAWWMLRRRLMTS